MKRMSEAQFLAAVGSAKFDYDTVSAMRDVLVHQMAVSAAANKWGVGRSSVYGAIHRLDSRGYKPKETQLVQTRVKAEQAPLLRYLIKCQLYAWQNGMGNLPVPEDVRAGVQTLAVSLDKDPAPVIRPMDPREFDDWDEE